MLGHICCACISRPTSDREREANGHIWIVKIRSSCPIHFNQRSARSRLKIMLRELTEGE